MPCIATGFPGKSAKPGRQLIYIAIDGLHPAYLELDAAGEPSNGNWLMPNIREFLDKAAIILLSDHSAVNHIATTDFMSTDVMGILIPFCIQDDIRRQDGGDAGLLPVSRGADDAANKDAA